MMAVVALLLLFVCNTYGSSQPFIWPLPQNYAISKTVAVNVDVHNFQFTQSQTTKSAVIATAITRYTNICFPHLDPEGSGDSGINTINGLILDIEQPSDDTLDYGMDESYDLFVPTAGGQAILNASTVWGALRGLETFSQMIVLNTTIRFYQAFAGRIQDKPRFSHRGILIDTARHFQSVPSIKKVLNGMSYNKFNVLHWHMTDGQSFPYESIVFPKLWDASYSSYERYLQSDVKEVIEYAKNLGIRVIAEFDMPGHSSSWCVGYPEICPSASCDSILNVAANATWSLLEGFIAEAANLFPDSHMHLGGDEVNTECWSNTSSVVEWMDANGYNASTALQFFNEKVVDIGHANNKLVIQWDEVFQQFGSTLDPTRAIVQVWHSGNALLPNAVASGFRSIFSPDPIWYLDQKEYTWQDRYVLEPFEYISEPSEQKLVLGGEACMWGETVDVSDIEQTIWPTASAVAERLWSLRTINSTKEASPRMEYFRCLMNQRGIAAAPPRNSIARSSPPHPGSCYDQRR